jgi:UDP-N-acetylmuramoyl-tripeptide--D-alanyl-D-alanine ligase
LTVYLHIFQQEEYDGPRFLKWVLRTGAVDRKVSVVILAVGVADFLLPAIWTEALALVLAIAFLIITWRESDPRKDAKKKLVLTARARRILVIALAFAGLLAAVAVSLETRVLWWLVPVHLLPVMLVLATLVLAPQEHLAQRRYWREAHDKLQRLAPTVIGITGSFGKTSVKHILAHVMETTSLGLATPGSVNTPMGIARIVRERLRPEHRYFIAEMGAYGPGSIARLCRLAPPDFAIVTAIGKAHYERFKTLETVARAKHELVEATLDRGGKIVLPDTLLAFEPFGENAAQNPDKMVLTGETAEDALQIHASEQTADGLRLEVEWRAERHVLEVPLHGLHQAGNVALAFAAACTLGVEPDSATAALRRMPQIAHRLEVKAQANGSTLIDDAYNANPDGFAAALDVLDRLAGADGRRILVTPGMVELGAAHDEEHRRLGEKAAGIVDVLLAVVPDRIESFLSAFEGRADRTVIRCPDFAAASAWLETNVEPGDAVLLENDLPDLYERRLRL